jgi:Sulfotransferase domain/N-terminal domain of galactosyltransferase
LQPTIVFCTTCKGRTQHIERTLPKNLADNQNYPNCKFLVLDYASQDNLLGYLLLNHRKQMQSGRLVVYSHTETGPFKMAHAKNMAHRLGILEGADILVNLDADNFTEAGFAEYIAKEFEQGEIFMWTRVIQGEGDRLPKGSSGRIVVSSHAFLKAGGYDEKYATWGPDDKDFNARLRRFGIPAVEIDRQYINVILHTDRMRFREYPEVATITNEEQIEVFEADNTVVNWGNVGCGTVLRNLDFQNPIELAPVPTRIFGIGMHKTGTTSLHAALKILGYDSAHWEDAHWAKRIWLEMSNEGRSRTLEKHYALSDLPITLLYEELDVAYPGSKFILTTRSEQGWLASVEAHWKREHNQFRGAWDRDPFTHKVHKLLYGQKGFNAELFLARFRQHNAEVLEYFKGRDLLVMNIDRAGWPELCGALGKPIPPVPYPKRFQTKGAR